MSTRSSYSVVCKWSGGECVCWYDYTNFNTWIAKYYYDTTVVVVVMTKGNCYRDIDRAMNTYIYSSQYTDPENFTSSGVVYEPLPTVDTWHVNEGCCSHMVVCQWDGGEFVCWYDYTNFNTWIAKYYYEATS